MSAGWSYEELVTEFGNAGTGAVLNLLDTAGMIRWEFEDSCCSVTPWHRPGTTGAVSYGCQRRTDHDGDHRNGKVVWTVAQE